MSDYIDNLRLLDSHERPILIQWAQGGPLSLGDEMRRQLEQILGLPNPIPEGAFVAMDYTLDWLFAAIQLTEGASPRDTHPWPAAENALKASIEDIDLLVAWVSADGKPHTILVEAKGYTGWSNKQMASKAARLKAIFPDRLEEKFDDHFVLAGPKESKGLMTNDWPEWMRRDGRVHFAAIPDPGDRMAVQRCTCEGDPSDSKPPTHWRLLSRTWPA